MTGNGKLTIADTQAWMARLDHLFESDRGYRELSVPVFHRRMYELMGSDTPNLHALEVTLNAFSGKSPSNYKRMNLSDLYRGLECIQTELRNRSNGRKHF